MVAVKRKLESLPIKYPAWDIFEKARKRWAQNVMAKFNVYNPKYTDPDADFIYPHKGLGIHTHKHT